MEMGNMIAERAERRDGFTSPARRKTDHRLIGATSLLSVLQIESVQASAHYIRPSPSELTARHFWSTETEGKDAVAR